jgi:4-amino-4-deoxy-L-arabinose transferase-like glycosyltransferase
MSFLLSAELSTKERTGQGFGREDFYSILVLCALCFVLFSFRIGTMPLWDVDEGMHAATSKDMVLTGDWVTPKTNGRNFYDKTALFNWFVAVSFRVFGFTEFASRLPAVLLGFFTVLITYLLGRRLFGSGAGLLGGVVLATSPEFIVLSRSVVHDISLAFFITAALSFFYQAFSVERRRRLNLMLFYASAGLAVLAKGPIGLLLPGMIIILFLLLRGRFDFLKEMSLGWGALVFLAVAAPWYVLISMRNEDYLSYFFLRQNLGNFLSKTQAHHPQPFYYFVPALLAGMLPWSFFVPLAIQRPLSGGLKKIDDGSLFLICWFAVIFLFFSAANSKLETYILPAFPAVALLIGGLWHEMMKSPTAGLRKGIGWSLAPLPLLFLGATAYIMIKQPVARKLQMNYGMNLHGMSGLLIAITLILIIALLLFVFRKYRSAFSALAATFSVGILIFLTAYVPSMDHYRSTRALAKEMDSMLTPGEPLVFYRKLWDSALFYTNRRATVLNTEEMLLEYLASNKKTLCLIEREQYEKLPAVAAVSRIVDEEGNRLLISGDPARRSPGNGADDITHAR